MTEKKIDKLLTTEEVAERYRTSASTVRYWRAIGYGPKGRRVGRRVLYDEQDVLAFWASLRPASGD
jgi:DNA-binding transcriptional MerR regulator